MARSFGSTTEASLRLKQRILALQSQGLSQAEIARIVGKSRSYISRVCSSGIPEAQVSKAAAIKAALEMKQQQPVLGPETIAWRLSQAGYSDIPHSQLLHQRFVGAGLSYNRPGTKNDRRSYHNYFRDGITRSCQRIQVDGAGPFSIAGGSYYLFIAQDRFSRLLYAEFVPHSYASSLVPFARRLVDFFGVAEEIQLDNSVTWRAQARHPGRFAWALLTLGVSRIHFIPEAQPARNGGVERQVGTLKHEFLRLFEDEYGLTFDSIESASASLSEFLHFYNCSRQHTALPRRPSSRRFHLTPSEVHRREHKEHKDSSDTSIAFTRFLGQGYAVLHSSIVIVFPEFSDRYVTFECRLDGTGVALHKGEVVGVFKHNFTNRNPDSSSVIRVSPVRQAAEPVRYRIDYLQYAKRLLEDNRHKRPRVSRLPSGWNLQVSDDGSWRLFDASGELVVDWLNADADHIIEFVPAWDVVKKEAS